MQKVDETVLAVGRDFLFEDEETVFQGIETDPYRVKELMYKFRKYVEVPRSKAENNPKWKQIIPYAVICRGDEVFVYKILKGSSEIRLHDKLSIGIGGHMNRINCVYNWYDNLMMNFYRELGEELNITGNFDYNPDIVGVINDDNGDAGLYHIGVLMVLDLPEHAEVTVRETNKLEGYWLRTSDLAKSPLFESLETWSQMTVKELFI